MMMYYLKLYAATFVGFLAIDIVWLAVMVPRFYQKHLGDLLSKSPNWWAAIVFYLLFIAGLLVFAVVPGLQAGSLRKAFLLGATTTIRTNTGHPAFRGHAGIHGKRPVASFLSDEGAPPPRAPRVAHADESAVDP